MSNIPLEVDFFIMQEGKEDAREQITGILRYLFELQEQLYYILGHITSDNFTEESGREALKKMMKDGIPDDTGGGKYEFRSDGIWYVKGKTEKKVVNTDEQAGT